MEVSCKIFGDEAKELAEAISGGDLGEYNQFMKVFFKIDSINGHIVVKASFEV